MVRLWLKRFGAPIATYLRRQWANRMKGLRHSRLHLDEVHVQINGEMHYLWCVVDHEGGVLESHVTKTPENRRLCGSCARH